MTFGTDPRNPVCVCIYPVQIVCTTREVTQCLFLFLFLLGFLSVLPKVRVGRSQKGLGVPDCATCTGWFLEMEGRVRSILRHGAKTGEEPASAPHSAICARGNARIRVEKRRKPNKLHTFPKPWDNSTSKSPSTAEPMMHKERRSRQH